MKKIALILFSLPALFANHAYADTTADVISAAENGDIKTLQRLADDDVNINRQYSMSGLLPGFPPIERWTPLMTAAVRNDIELAQYLIDMGADCNSQTYSGNAALHWAARKGNPSVVKILLQGGADINLQNNIGETPLYWACSSIQYDNAKALLRAGADIHLYKDMYSPLWVAARNGSWRIVGLLLRQGAVPDSEVLLAAAGNSGSTKVIERLIHGGVDLGNSAGYEALGNLIENGDTAGFCLLIDAGAPWDEKHFWHAFASARTGMVRKLLSEGADPDSCCSELTKAALLGDEASIHKLLENGGEVDAKDSGGKTALAAACAAGHQSAISALIGSGADVNMTFAPAFDGRSNTRSPTAGEISALVLAAAAGDSRVCKILLENGADPNLPTDKGYKPLHAAARDGDAATVKLLIDAGAQPDPVYLSLYTPMVYAVRRNTPSIVQTLLDKGADPFFRTLSGATYLHIAAESDSTDVIGLLVKSGLDAEALDGGKLFYPDSKETPLERIRGRGYSETESVFKRFGAEE